MIILVTCRLEQIGCANNNKCFEIIILTRLVKLSYLLVSEIEQEKPVNAASFC